MLLVAGAASATAQHESKLHADLRHEGDDFKQDCKGGIKGAFGCVKDLFADWPLHIAVGSIAPQNGFGAGAAFVEHKDLLDWRLSWDADAIGSINNSWRTGLYMKAIHTAGACGGGDCAVVNGYIQSISLNTIPYYGIGSNTSRNAEAIFGMRETIAGASLLHPFVPKLHLAVFGELNGRFVQIRDGVAGTAGPISALYNEATAPGLIDQPAFLQLGEGIRFNPSLIADHLQLGYSATYQQFVAPGSGYSFQRFTADLNHAIPLYRGVRMRQVATKTGPDECTSNPSQHECPTVVNRYGAVNLRFLLSESFTESGNQVPFYFQPTLGGANLNGEQLLPSYADYRFRAPNVMMFRASFEHSLYGPVGFQFLYDLGKAAATHGDIDFNHMAHSFGVGLTVRAGGVPELSLLFAFGGGEGTHTLALVNNSLMGGSPRPSLF